MKEVQGENYMQTALYGVPSLAVAAHELKAPLALIRQLSLTLKDEPAEHSLQHPEVRQLLDRLRLTSERSLRLVEMLTRHARLEDSLFELEPVNVSQICEETAHEFMPLCAATGQSIEVHASKRSVLAVANYELLRSVAFGLYDNALAHSTSQKPISVTIGQQADTVRMGVRDYGPLVSADTFKNLRERLGKTKQPIGQRPNSSGLGLYIAGQFAEAMQGRLGAVRHRNNGTTFYLDTPISAQLSLLAL
jgi:signal transduction histidine kinase